MSKRDATRDDAILRQAKDRFKRAEEFETTARKNFTADLKFSQGDAYNGWQWPTDLSDARDGDNLPCLTINKTKQHNLQIINDARQNKSSIKITPVGDGATYEAAQVIEGIVRHIEYISDAQTAYSSATWFQVQAGKGYLRVVTDYVDDTFDQEIFIRRVNNPLSIYLDPDAKQFDRSDGRFAFVFDDVPRDKFEADYPQYKDRPAADVTFGSDDWCDKDHVRIAEYFRRVEKADKIVSFDQADGTPFLGRLSKVAPTQEIRKALLADPSVKSRDITDYTVEWFKIVGNEICERGEWIGSTIPIVPVIGEETLIEGKYDCKGHTRALIDAQRMYNYWTSEATAQVALQGKSPFMAPVGSTDGLEQYYETANRVNHAVLPYNAYDDDGRPLPPPERSQPPVMGQAFMQGMATAASEMQMVSGQYQAEMGAPSNERSGVAIQQRQRQGDNATYHFVDHNAMAVRRVGKIILDIYDKVYDTPRTLKILGEDGSEELIEIDPQAKQAHQLKQASQKGEVDQVLFNPSIGRYDVQADIGPSFGTKRQEAFNALTQLAGQSPELMQIGGDLVLKAADFPYANELAERWARTIPAHITGDAPPPELQQMQQQLQQLQQILQNTVEELAKSKQDNDDGSAKAETEKFRALTDRMEVLFKQFPSPKDVATAVHELMVQEHSITLTGAVDQQTQARAAVVQQALQPAEPDEPEDQAA